MLQGVFPNPGRHAGWPSSTQALCAHSGARTDMVSISISEEQCIAVPPPTHHSGIVTWSRWKSLKKQLKDVKSSLIQLTIVLSRNSLCVYFHYMMMNHRAVVHVCAIFVHWIRNLGLLWRFVSGDACDKQCHMYLNPSIHTYMCSWNYHTYMHK